MRPTYLSGERVYLRGMLDDDASSALAWYGSDFPVNTGFGEERLKELHKEIWDNPKLQLAIVQSVDDQLIGGAMVRFGGRDRKASFEIQIAPLKEDRGKLQADALRVLVAWLIDDHNMRRVDVMLRSNEVEATQAALEIGMVEAVRLREYWRTYGGRIDGVIFHKFNPNEERRDA